VVLAVFVHGRGLEVAPLSAGEYEMEAQARGLMERHGHDADGRLLPLFIESDRDDWLAPLPLYVSAVIATLVPATTVHGRWVAAVSGIVDIALIFVLASRCIADPAAGWVAALALLITPTHVIFSRSAAPDGIWPLPFILAWAIGLTALAERPSLSTRSLFAAGTGSLAALVYAQSSAALLVPCLAIVTLHCFSRATSWRPSDARPAVATTVGVLLALFVWLVRFADTQARSFALWLLLPADARSMFRAATILKAFWDFWMPSHLFLKPDVPGLCAMFLVAMAVPIAVGVHASMRRGAQEEGLVKWMREPVLAVCLLGPLLAATATQTPSDGRALVVVPFGVLLAVRGVIRMRRDFGIVGRLLLGVLVLGAAVQAALCSQR
jgi:hypothetical protein